MTAPSRSVCSRLAAGALALAAAVLLAMPAQHGRAQSSTELAGKELAGKDRVPDERPEQFPDGPNREDTFYFCTACHGFKIVAAQGMSRTRWNETLNFMVTRHNMPDVQGEERERILDYLTSAFPERTQPGGWRNPFAPR